MSLVPESLRDPRFTSTRGTGELIKAALDEGLRKIIIGLGGSATNDGGAGMARALGIRFLSSNGLDIPEGGAALRSLQSIDLGGADPRLHETEIIAACDVDNPLCGKRGASVVFGPQKGATPEMIKELDQALKNYAKCAYNATGRKVENQPGAGAAGGLGAGLLYFTKAQLKPGVTIVLDAIGFTDIVKDAFFVMTGEGRTDFQTAYGKAPVGIAKVSKQFNVPVFCISGGLGEGASDVLSHGIDAVMSICDRPMSLKECMDQSEWLIEAASERLCRIVNATNSTNK
jgi:glycerate kinase